MFIAVNRPDMRWCVLNRGHGKRERIIRCPSAGSSGGGL